jgi:Catalase
MSLEAGKNSSATLNASRHAGLGQAISGRSRLQTPPPLVTNRSGIGKSDFKLRGGVTHRQPGGQCIEIQFTRCPARPSDDCRPLGRRLNARGPLKKSTSKPNTLHGGMAKHGKVTRYRFASATHPNEGNPYRRLSPESLHQVTILLSDRGIRATYWHMKGHSSHTYSAINRDDGIRHWIKIHCRTNQGIMNRRAADAKRVKGQDKNHARRDLFASIERGEFPKLTRTASCGSTATRERPRITSPTALVACAPPALFLASRDSKEMRAFPCCGDEPQPRSAGPSPGQCAIFWGICVDLWLFYKVG